MQSFDLQAQELRDLNAALQAQSGDSNQTEWEVTNPRGSHAVAVGLDAPIEVHVRGPVGYYCAGMNQQATVHVHDSAGPGVAEISRSTCMEMRASPTAHRPLVSTYSPLSSMFSKTRAAPG